MGKTGNLDRRVTSENTTITDVKKPRNPSPGAAGGKLRARSKTTGKKSQTASAFTLLQAVCTDGTFCQQTHKPGLCKGQHRGQTEPGTQEAVKQTPAQKAQIAVTGLQQAIAQATQVATQNATNPKLAAMARKAIAGYKQALGKHQQTLKQAQGTDAHSKATADRDTREQDRLDKAAQRHKDAVAKRAQAILNRRAEKAKLAKMSPAQRRAYHKAKAAAAAKKHKQQEDQTLKEAGKA